MKILIIYYDRIDCDRYLYPEGISTPTEFAAYLERNEGRFIPMQYYSDENCAFPYYIEQDIKTKYLNVSLLKSFEECDITVLPREEYNERLKAVVAATCVHCVNDMGCGCDECDCGDGVRGRMTLDGKCWGFQRKHNADKSDDA